MRARPPIAVFRADASAQLGAGHISRCAVIAEALRGQGWQTAFAVNAAAPDLVPSLAMQNEILFCDPDPEIAAAQIRAAWPDGITALLVDHYGLGADFESRFVGFADRRVALDDLPDRAHDVDILIDPNLGHAAVDFSARVPVGARVLQGTAYAPLRPDFAASRPGCLRRRETAGPPRRLLLSLGGMDGRNLLPTVLQTLEVLESTIPVDLAVGSATPNRAAIEATAEAVTYPLHLHWDAPHMADLMASADLSIGSGGVMSWERCCLGLPSLILLIADNQVAAGGALAAAGAAIVLDARKGLDVQAFGKALAPLLRGEGVWEMSQRASDICDGQGVRRILEAIHAALSGSKAGGG